VKTLDESELPVEASSAEDYEARGFRLLARIIARHLFKQNYSSEDKSHLKTDDFPDSKDNR